MKPMDNFRKIIISGTFTLGILLFPGSVLAATDIDIDFPTPPGPIITETNILPGNVFTRTVTITKLNDNSDVGLMLRLDRMNSTGTYNLESKILVKIQRLSDSEFLILPGGSKEKTLESLYDYLDSLNSDAFQFDSISGLTNSTYQYKLWFTFDPLTDNNYQGKSTTFDILMGIYTQDATPTTDGGGHNNNNGGGGGGNDPAGAGLASPGLLGLTEAITGPTGGGVIGPGEVQGAAEEEVAGAETGCSQWPLWIWILILAAYLGIFNALSFYKLKERKDFRWFGEIALTAGGLLLWVYYDKCDWYPWFPYAGAVLGGASYGYYYYTLKKLLSAATGQVK